jgi:hypothetical protein
LVSGKIVGLIDENRQLEKVLIEVPLALMCTLFSKFGGLDVALGFLVEEDCKFYLTSIFVAVIMVKKITYKKRRRNDCTTDYKFFTRLETQTRFVY